jgi:hypothetical protein
MADLAFDAPPFLGILGGGRGLNPAAGIFE